LKETITSVQEYFEDEKALLEDWYNDFFSIEMFPGEPMATMPSLNKIQDAFEEWVEKVRFQLYNLICIEWDYRGKYKNERFYNKVKLAAELADFLISCTWKIPAPIATATLLVKIGMERICDNYPKGWGDDDGFSPFQSH